MAEKVIDATAEVIASDWTLVPDEAPWPDSGAVIVTPARLLATPPATLPQRLGVVLAPADQPDALAPLLHRLALVAVSFPRFRDGRGFTQARRLREFHGFAGDIRAVGHVLPDQFLALLRCGVTSVALAEGQQEAVWRAVLALRAGHDSAAPDQRRLPLLRRLAAPIAVA